MSVYTMYTKYKYDININNKILIKTEAEEKRINDIKQFIEENKHNIYTTYITYNDLKKAFQIYPQLLDYEYIRKYTDVIVGDLLCCVKLDYSKKNIIGKVMEINKNSEGVIVFKLFNCYTKFFWYIHPNKYLLFRTNDYKFNIFKRNLLSLKNMLITNDK